MRILWQLYFWERFSCRNILKCISMHIKRKANESFFYWDFESLLWQNFEHLKDFIYQNKHLYFIKPPDYEDTSSNITYYFSFCHSVLQRKYGDQHGAIRDCLCGAYMYQHSTTQQNPSIFVLFITTILSSAAFVWYGDFSSFLALVSSLILLSFRSKSRKLKILFILPVLLLIFHISVSLFQL